MFHNASSGDVKKCFLRESGSPRYHHSALAFFALCALVWRGEKLLSFGDFARGETRHAAGEGGDRVEDAAADHHDEPGAAGDHREQSDQRHHEAEARR